MIKEYATLILVTFVSTHIFAGECKFKDADLKQLKESGGFQLCGAKKNSGFYDLDGNLMFQAYWKAKLTAALTTHEYPPYALPKDKVKVTLTSFPIKDFSITKLYGENSDGKITEPAKLSPLPVGEVLNSKQPVVITYELLPTLKEFRLVVEGKTSKGKNFIQYSSAIFKTTNQTDREIGNINWDAFLSSFKDNMSNDEKTKMRKEAFQE